MKLQIYTHQFGKIIPLVFLCSLFAVGTAFAGGQIVIKPIIETGWQRDTNFYKSDNNTKTIDTYYIKPIIELGYKTPKSTVTLDYSLKHLKYNDQDDVAAGQLQADELDYNEHHVNFKASTRPSDRSIVGIDNIYWNTRDSANTEAVSNGTELYEYSLNQFRPWMQYRFGDKFGMNLVYTNEITDYSDDGPGQGEDTDEDRGTFTLLYDLNKKTSFDLDFQYWKRTYDKTTSDYDSGQVMANIYQQFNYVTVGVGAGYQDREFDEAVPSGDIDKFVWKLSVSGQNPPDAAGIPRSSVYIAVSSNLNDSGSGETYYEATRLDAKFTYRFMERLNCTLAGFYQNSDYETSDRDDDRWLVSGAVDYWLDDFCTIGIEGGMEERDSNEEGRDFDNSYVLFKVSFAPDFGSK